MKVVHLIEYGLLAILWNRGLSRSTTWGSRVVGIVAVALTVAWGISDEIHQAFVPGRTPRVADVFTNLVGAMAATWLWPRLTGAIRRTDRS